jgi:hypothetical protein
MIPFLIKLWMNPLARKIITWAAIIGLMLYALRIYGNKQWEKGNTAGRAAAAQDIDRQKRDEWKQKEHAIAAAAGSLEEEKRVIRAAAVQLEKDRGSIETGLNNSLAFIRQERNRHYETTASVSDDHLDAALRAVSSELSTHP